METNKVLSLLGLAARSRNIVTGEELVVKGIQNGKVQFVIITTDASENTKKKLTDKAGFYNVPYKIIFERNELGHAIGKESRVSVGIIDCGFSKQLERLLE